MNSLVEGIKKAAPDEAFIMFGRAVDLARYGMSIPISAQNAHLLREKYCRLGMFVTSTLWFRRRAERVADIPSGHGAHSRSL